MISFIYLPESRPWTWSVATGKSPCIPTTKRKQFFYCSVSGAVHSYSLGFCNVLGTFELLMEGHTGPAYKPCLVYLDHAFLGQTFQERLEHLLTVFQRSGVAHLTLNPEKCELFQKKLQLQRWISETVWPLTQRSRMQYRIDRHRKTRT